MMRQLEDRFRTDEAFALEMDAKDPLAGFRERFYMPTDTIYLDGNSLGLFSRDSEAAMNRVLDEWKNKAIEGWLGASTPWFYLSEQVGKMAEELVGAAPDEVICAGSTTINLHSLLSTFYTPTGTKTKILAGELDFPSDVYALKGQIKLRGLDPDEHLVLAPSQDGCLMEEDDIIAMMTDDVALVLLPSVLYCSGQLLDIPRLARAARERGIVIGVDCCHSAGVVPHRFSEWGVDFAVWCGYKYLNGGPGSPAFLYVNRRHFDREPLLAGWFGGNKETQFNMSLQFEAAGNAGGWQISTPGIVGTAGVEGGLTVVREAGIHRIREKSLHMTSYFIFLLDQMVSGKKPGLLVKTPRDLGRRGGHVAIGGGEETWLIHQALKARGVMPDFRPPGMIRFAPVALYNTYHEVRQTVCHLNEIIDSGEYRAFGHERSAIT